MLDIGRTSSTSTSVQALTGSSRPGAVPPLMALGAATAGAARGLVARRPDPDAEVIDLAERLAALAPRQDRVLRRACKIEGRHDAWNYANRPSRPAERPSRMVRSDLSTATHRIMQLSEPLAEIEAARREEEDYEAALEAHERRLERKIAGSRYPYLIKLADRMWFRMARFSIRLAAMEPRTPEGIAAKSAAAAAVAVTAADLDWGQDLLASASREAARLPVPHPAPAARIPTLTPNDARLIVLANEAEATEAACNAFTAEHRGRENDATERAFGELCSNFGRLEDEIAAVPADTMAGVLAKARAAQVPALRAFDDCPFGLSLADDLWRLFGVSSKRGAALPAASAA